jgi:hypothetical protein
MILRSLTVCLAAVIAWHFLQPRMPENHHRIPGQVRANHHRAQTYVLNAPPNAEVVAGSSMSDRLDAANLGPDRVKLTFPGGGPLTALEIIRRSGRVPPVLWFETNLIVRDADETLIGDATDAWRVGLRRNSSAFTEHGRPSAYGVGIVRTLFGRACRVVPALGGAPPTPSAGTSLDPAVFEGMMSANRLHLSKKPDPADLERRVKLIGEAVDSLHEAGCKVVFYEMPCEPSLKDLAEPAAIREAMRHRFPTSGYRWLDLSRDSPWQTTDGIHLTPSEAAEVADRMNELARSL